ncbi:hypothetical protein N7456_011141 [Penicillium angulare]|uniref:Uncharacterized protein n=1 Tax=Penicillium angulare TaxID=116970 RepID=A0A9W9JZS2_9EURO|nr:hypothetical protein N7456_011141 [Penicillium angulare]
MVGRRMATGISGGVIVSSHLVRRSRLKVQSGDCENVRRRLPVRFDDFEKVKRQLKMRVVFVVEDKEGQEISKCHKVIEGEESEGRDAPSQNLGSQSI